MKLEKGVLYMITGAKFYEEEESGRKPYTVRLIDHVERMQLEAAKPTVVRIFLSNHGSSTYFTREGVRIHDLDRLLGKYLVGISWDPRSEL